MDIQNTHTNKQYNTCTARTIMSIGALALVISMCAWYGYWRYYTTNCPAIYAFNKERDMQAILHIFQRDMYWLVADSKHYSPEFTLNYLAPTRNRRYLGKLKIDVMRTRHDLMGFVAYYIVSPGLGRLLFLAVDNKFRRQKCGERLLRYGLRQLIQMGAQKIELCTRTNNIPAQTLYKRVGFYETSRDEGEGFVYFMYDAAKHTP